MEIVGITLHGPRAHELVLRVRDGILDARRRVLLVVEIQLFKAFLDNRLAVRRIINDEIAFIDVRCLNLTAQETRTERMERAEPDVFRGVANHAVHALAHFRRGLVRERDGEDVVRCHTIGKQVRDAAGQDLRLARARARHDEQRTVNVRNRFFLCRIQATENIQMYPPICSFICICIYR